jgi:hypothetical protein
MLKLFCKSPSARSCIAVELRRTSTYGELITIVKTKHRYLDPRVEFDGIPLDPTSTLNPAVGTDRRNPIMVIGKQAPKGGLLPPKDIYAWVRLPPLVPGSTDRIPKYPLPAHLTIGHLLAQLFIDPAFSRYQSRERRLVFDSAAIDLRTPIGAVRTTEANPVICCFLDPPSAYSIRHWTLPPLPAPRPLGPNSAGDPVVHIAAFDLDPARSNSFGAPIMGDGAAARKCALPPGSRVAALLGACGGSGAVFMDDRVFGPEVDLTDNRSTEFKPFVVCILPPRAVAEAAVSPAPALFLQPDDGGNDLVELFVQVPDAPPRTFDIRLFAKTQTVADAIRALQPAQEARGRPARKVSRLQLDGVDLPLDLCLGTIVSDGIHPISLVFECTDLSPEEEGKVASVLRAMDGWRTRGEVIAALERNGWDEAGAITERCNQARPSPAQRTSRFLPPAATGAPAPRFADPSQEEPGANRWK